MIPSLIAHMITPSELREYAEAQLEEFLRDLPNGETNFLVSSAALALAQARHAESPTCPDCERPNPSGGLCSSCLQAREECGRIAGENNDGKRENE